MVAPWLVKMAIAEGLDRAGAPKELKALAGGPKNFLLDKFKNGVDQAAGVPAGTTNLITNPKGALIGAAKDYAKQEALNTIRGVNRDDGGDNAVDYQPMQFDEPDMASMEWEGDYKRGGKVKAKSSFKPSKASSRGDGIAKRGKTRGRYV